MFLHNCVFPSKIWLQRFPSITDSSFQVFIGGNFHPQNFSISNFKVQPYCFTICRIIPIKVGIRMRFEGTAFFIHIRLTICINYVILWRANLYSIRSSKTCISFRSYMTNYFIFKVDFKLCVFILIIKPKFALWFTNGISIYLFYLFLSLPCINSTDSDIFASATETTDNDNNNASKTFFIFRPPKY